MVVAKTSRKGKKAWRRNIDAAQELQALAKATEEERQGTAVAQLQDGQLFYVDKEGAAPAPTTPSRGRRRPQPPKTSTKAQSILAAAHRALPVQQTPKRGPKGRASHSTLTSSSVAVAAYGQQCHASQLDEGCAVQLQPPTLQDPWSMTDRIVDTSWSTVQPASARPPPSLRKRKQVDLAPMPALEVDEAGCSFNPQEDAHQDALALAVAAQVAKDIAQELLRPAAPPKMVEYAAETDPLAQLQVDAEEDAEDSLEDDEVACKAVQVARKTKVDLNKAQRRRTQQAAEAAKLALKKQRRDIDSLAVLQQQLDDEEQGRAAKRARRQANRHERGAEQPPKLGAVQFDPEPLHVLLSEEVDGSLRTVKAAPMVLRERYKSLQRRGVIEPRVPVKPKQGKRVTYVQGSRIDAAQDRQEELVALRKHNKQARKVAAQKSW